MKDFKRKLKGQSQRIHVKLSFSHTLTNMCTQLRHAQYDIDIHTSAHTHTHMYMYTHTHLTWHCTCTHTHTHIHTHTCNVHSHTHTHTHTCKYNVTCHISFSQNFNPSMHTHRIVYSDVRLYFKMGVKYICNLALFKYPSELRLLLLDLTASDCLPSQLHVKRQKNVTFTHAHTHCGPDWMLCFYSINLRNRRHTKMSSH